MNTFRIILYIIGIIALLVVTLLLYLTLPEYKPKKIQMVDEADHSPVLNQDTFNIVTWNIGYGGLGADMSFFYDGGKQVRSSQEKTLENLRMIKKKLKQFDHFDYILLQEVDIAAKRSYRINQLTYLDQNLQNFYAYFGVNYRVKYVPIPVTEPLGKVKSGIAILSRDQPGQVLRYGYPGKYPWPKSAFMLDRCFLVSRYPLAGSGELVIINTHNSAYDDGKLKKEEMKFLKQFLLKTYRDGNYILVGGDWNQLPPGLKSSPPYGNSNTKDNTPMIAEQFMPVDWKWIFDPHIPTNRALDEPYSDATHTRILDFFLASPNIHPITIKTMDLKFEYSDHQPVYLQFALQ